MSIENLKEFFMWCTIINAGIFTFSFIVIVASKRFIHQIHSKLIPITFEQFNVIMYSSFSLLKILIFVFNVIPYIVLEIMS